MAAYFPATPLRTPKGYDAVTQRPDSPPRHPQDQYDSPYDAADIQDDPYAQNPNLFRLPGAANQRARYNDDPAMTSYQPDYAASSQSFHPHFQYPSDPNYPYPLQASYDRPINNGSPPYPHAFDGRHSSRLSDPRAFRTDDSFEKSDMYTSPRESRRKRFILVALVITIIAALAGGGLALYFLVLKPKFFTHTPTSTSPSTASSGPSKSGTTAHTLVTTGGDGSMITADDGSQFVYSNAFGGTWALDPANPLNVNNGARAQSDTPPLNETWQFGVDRIQGVNIGGWLVLEPFITPALFEKYNGTVDEFMLSTAMAQDTSPGGGIGQIETHYATFITEQDFANIAGAGLNWVRIPLAFWAIETWDGEPYLAKVSWTYFLKAVEWARKYGLRINLDYHATPGSQNGWNHSGKLGDPNFLNGVMGMANAQRTLSYLEIIAQWICQDQYKAVIPMFSFLNEALYSTIGETQIQSFYLEAYRTIRSISGVGTGSGPMLAFHDGFQGLQIWSDFLPNADRLALDTHQYLCFGDVASAAPLSTFVQVPCASFQAPMTASLSSFGMTMAGEWSLAINDCGLNVNGVGIGTRFEGTFPGNSHPAVGTCPEWEVWENWNATTREQLQQFALMQMDALQSWFFWTWKIGNSTAAGSVRAPFWSYSLGLEQGWMPTNPRTAAGMCTTPGFAGPLQPWQTGGVGADEIPAASAAALPWPPVSINGAPGPGTALPQYTPTGTLVTLPVATFTAAPTVVAGDGWANAQMTLAAYVPIPGCTYLPEYGGVGQAVPAACAAAAGAGVAPALITPAPSA